MVHINVNPLRNKFDMLTTTTFQKISMFGVILICVLPSHLVTRHQERENFQGNYLLYSIRII